MNNLVPTGGNAVAVASGNPFLDAAEDMGASSGSLFLKFNGNSGEFTYGTDNEELELGTQLAVNANEFKRGWICWNDGSVVDEIMVRVTEGKPPSKHQLDDNGPYENDNDGWSEQSSVALRDIETGDEYLFKSSSKSGRIAIGNLVRDYGKAFQMHPGELAIVELDATSFTPKNAPKSAGKKYAPALKIVGWTPEAELMAKFSGGADEDGVEYDDDEPTEEVSEPAPKAEAKKAPAEGGRRARRF